MTPLDFLPGHHGHHAEELSNDEELEYLPEKIIVIT